MPQHLDLTDDEAAALTRELHEIVENDRYPFSPRIRTLGAVLNKLSPEPAREPLPAPPKGLRAVVERQIPATTRERTDRPRSTPEILSDMTIAINERRS